MSPTLFPCLLIFLDFCAATVWFAGGDLRKGLYWISAGILTATVTF